MTKKRSANSPHESSVTSTNLAKFRFCSQRPTKVSAKHWVEGHVFPSFCHSLKLHSQLTYSTKSIRTNKRSFNYTGQSTWCMEEGKNKKAVRWVFKPSDRCTNLYFQGKRSTRHCWWYQSQESHIHIHEGLITSSEMPKARDEIWDKQHF